MHCMLHVVQCNEQIPGTCNAYGVYERFVTLYSDSNCLTQKYEYEETGALGLIDADVLYLAAVCFVSSQCAGASYVYVYVEVNAAYLCCLSCQPARAWHACLCVCGIEYRSLCRPTASVVVSTDMRVCACACCFYHQCPFVVVSM